MAMLTPAMAEKMLANLVLVDELDDHSFDQLLVNISWSHLGSSGLVSRRPDFFALLSWPSMEGKKTKKSMNPFPHISRRPCSAPPAIRLSTRTRSAVSSNS